ncbi:MAG TPA: amidohydrolase family protein [Gryllotalpicola sp.]
MDPDGETTTPDRRIVIEAGGIVAVEPDGSEPVAAGELDASGCFAVPGLIDCHVHLTAASADEWALTGMSPSFVALDAAAEARRMLARGFTTVRDMGGADWGLALAVESGLLEGPRVLFCGHALSATGGHGDLRPRGRSRIDPPELTPGIGLVTDGEDALRGAVRNEFRRGASHIKLMVSGGVSSPADAIDTLQYSDDEIRAAVNEAARVGAYVAAHAYTATAIERAVRLGVRSIEHGNLLDEAAAEAMATQGAHLVPTLVTYAVLEEEGPASGLPPTSVAKVAAVRERGEESLAVAARAEVPMAYGSDLLGGMRLHQSEEFRIRARTQTSWEVLRGATTNAARLLGHPGVLGVVAPGAVADLILTDANPGHDVTVLADPDRSVSAVIAGGRMLVDRASRPPVQTSTLPGRAE